MSVIPFPDAARRDSNRLLHLIKQRGVDAAGASLGTPDDWAWSAIGYLKAEVGSQTSGSAEVSVTAVQLLLGYVERLAGQLGIIPDPEDV